MRDPLVILVPLLVWFLLCCAVGRAAASFHRSPVNWFVLAFLTSPLVAFVFLLFAGDQQETSALREREERLRQRYPDRKDIREAALNEMQCPQCGATVNPITADGLHSPADEPWLLICNQCLATIEPDG